MGFPLARVLQIGSIGAALIPGAGPVIAAGMLAAAKAVADGEGSPEEQKWDIWEEQSKRWVKMAKKLDDSELSSTEKAQQLRAIIRADLRAVEGNMPSEADVNLYAEAAVAAARID